MVIYNNHLRGIANLTNNNQTQVKKDVSNEGAFAEILQSKISQNEDVKISKHAEMRLKTRNIELTSTQKAKISDAVKKADSKGIKDSLVMIDNIALIVNVKSKTVITAVNSNELKDNVFTNIDGAVFT